MAEDGDLDLIHRSKGEECVNSKYIESWIKWTSCWTVVGMREKEEIEDYS